MLQRLQQAGLIGPTLAAIVALGVLVSLGTWQVQRKHWKEGLIARIAARTTAPPVALDPDSDPLRSADKEYLHVAVSGRLLHDKERYLFAPAPTGLGWHVYVPLETVRGQLIWINRGFVPDERRDPATRAEGLIPGTVQITGLVRTPAPKGMFVPDNNVAKNQWYWPDIAAMTASAFPDGRTARMVLPYRIDADALPEPPGGLPKGGVTRLELPNRHLEYAVTWYGLALTLIGVYSAFAASRIKAGRG